MQKLVVIFALSFFVLFHNGMAQTDIPLPDSLKVIKADIEKVANQPNTLDSAQVVTKLKELAKDTVKPKADSLATPLLDEQLKRSKQSKEITAIRDSLLITNYPMYKEYMGVLRDSTLISSSLDAGEKRLEKEIIERTDELGLLDGTATFDRTLS